MCIYFVIFTYILDAWTPGYIPTWLTWLTHRNVVLLVELG